MIHLRSWIIAPFKRYRGRVSSQGCSADPVLVRAALQPKVFTYVDQLVKHIQNNFILHEPGRFLIIPKPYGISCLGKKQENGGVFKNSVYDNSVDKESMNVKILVNSNNVTMADCIPFLARIFNEPELTFCTGIKRYCSGAIVLPANPIDFENIKKSIIFASKRTDECLYQHQGLAIVLSSPPELVGTISGYVTFQTVGKHKEYIFVEGKAKKRAKTGKFAVEGSMEYRVLDQKYGCSLVVFAINKFARHLPRLMFTHLLCPILGDKIYSNRLLDINGIPTLIKPTQNRMLSAKCYQPSSLLNRLGKSSNELLETVPMYCHIHQSIFPRFGWDIGRPRNQQQVSHLIANAPPPSHFLAMVDALNMSDSLAKYFREMSDSDDNPE